MSCKLLVQQTNKERKKGCNVASLSLIYSLLIVFTIVGTKIIEYSKHLFCVAQLAYIIAFSKTFYHVIFKCFFVAVENKSLSVNHRSRLNDRT